LRAYGSPDRCSGEQQTHKRLRLEVNSMLFIIVKDGKVVRVEKENEQPEDPYWELPPTELLRRDIDYVVLDEDELKNEG
jgi:hypothetical protein